MATELVKSGVTNSWTDVAGAAASTAGVYWQNVGNLPIYLAFTTSAPTSDQGFVFLAPGLSFHDDTGSAHVWAKTASGVSTVTATLDPAAGGGGGGGGGGAAYTDISIATLSGSNEQLAAANSSRKVLFITNIGNATVNVNLTGGTAAAGAGSFPILAGATALFDTNVPTNQINIIGTAGQPVTAYEG